LFVSGWNSWNHYKFNINEDLVKKTANAIVSSGLKDVGYVYVNIDDGWSRWRDKQGHLHPNNKTFPGGMKSLGDYGYKNETCFLLSHFLFVAVFVFLLMIALIGYC